MTNKEQAVENKTGKQFGETAKEIREALQFRHTSSSIYLKAIAGCFDICCQPRIRIKEGKNILSFLEVKQLRKL